MSDIGDIVILNNEKGDEVEYEIVHLLEYENEKYCVLSSEEDDNVIVVKEDDEEYRIVNDHDALMYVYASLSAEQEFAKKEMEAAANNDNADDDLPAYVYEPLLAEYEFLKLKIRVLIDETDDFMQEIDDFIESYPNNNEFDGHKREKILESLSDHHIKIGSFDLDKYLNQSQDCSFLEANSAYVKADYKRAIEEFTKAEKQGNIYASTHLGMMHYYGYGCEQDRKEALKNFKKGAKNGCPLAAAWVSDCYRLGQGIDKDKEFAQELYDFVIPDLRKMCEAGDMAACYFLGYNLIMGIGGEENEEEGVKLLSQAYEKGEQRATVPLAECYYNGWGVPEDPARTVAILIKNPMPSNKKAQYLLGLCNYYGNGIEKNFDRALFHFKAAASFGHGRAKDYLGDCYYNGQGTEINYTEAAKWYKDATDNNGIGESAHSLAFMYMKGEGVPEDINAAMQYFLIAAEKGIAQAQRIVSREYVSGNNLEQDYGAARFWMEKAAEQGDAEAQVALGRYYISDFGFDDEKEAFNWFMRAAKQGHAEAEYIVGGCYANGLGTSEDYEKANEWFRKAVLDGYDRAKLDIGMNYLTGKGTEKDSSMGIELISQLANTGLPEANKALAKAYYYGISNYKGQQKYTDSSEAYKYAIEAAKDERDGESQYILASILHKTFGKVEEAKKWYIRAVENGSEDAKLELSKIYIESGENYGQAFQMLKELVKERNAEAQYYLGLCYDNGYGCAKDKKMAKSYYQTAASNGYTNNNIKKKRFGFF